MKKAMGKKKTAWGQYIGMGLFMLTGAACGFLMTAHMDECMRKGRTLGETLPKVALLIAGMYAAIVLQLIVHEAGHLAFGLMSGYRFCSFRVFSLMWVKPDGKIRLRRMSIAGTGGQCLMAPPDMRDGKIPVTLYNLGGSLMNLLTGAAALGLFFAAPQGLGTMTLLVMAVTGFALALMNGIPLHMGVMDNDGMNVVTLRRDAEAMRSFWIQMKVNELQTQGVRLRDMPEAWFNMPDDEAMKSGLVAAQGVLVCNRLMDQHRFAEADGLMAHMLEQDGMVALHRCLLICDRMYVEMISENQREVIESMRTKEQVALMKKMKRFPSILRTAYAYALLCQGNEEQGADFLAEFDRVARSYPYPADIQSERELMELARKKTA